MTIAHTSTCFFGSVFGGFGIWAAGCGRGCSPNTALTTLKKADQAGMMNRNIAGQHI